ncbi:hypothetical protein [Desulfotignum balticum]|uniref:hypothetical protein n=1 Tax=Desulfotignum balticum TaxID=115781 RepID=UPI00041AEFB0|nr:hypothetical protein [Desulfotignum balticum]
MKKTELKKNYSKNNSISIDQMSASYTTEAGWHVTVPFAKLRSVTYKKRFLIFLDVLGWRERVSHEDIKEIQTFLILCESFLEGHLKYRKEKNVDIQVSMISDTLLFSIPSEPISKELKEHIWFILDVVQGYIKAAATIGLLIRVSMVVGELSHKGYICYGPALIRAYDIEKNEAKVPRVIVDFEVTDLFIKLFGWKPNKRLKLMDKETKKVSKNCHPFFGAPIITDTDGAIFFNWLWDSSMPILDGLAHTVKILFSGKTFKRDYHEKNNWFLNYLNKEGENRGSTPWEPIPPSIPNGK